MKKINWSQSLHWSAGLAGFSAVVFLVMAWIAGNTGQILSMDQTHLYKDAAALLGIAVWLSIATLIHQNLEWVE